MIENNSENAAGTEVKEETAPDEGRPPVDPHNKLYTVLSLLIFAVLYVGVQLFKANFTLSYALYSDIPDRGSLVTVLSEIGMSEVPEDCEFEYARMHKNFDSNLLYVSFALPEEIEGIEEAEEFASGLVPYEYGNIAEDERFTLYPDPDMNALYVYGSSIVCIDDPLKRCIVYEDEDSERYKAVFLTDEYDKGIAIVLSEGVKINVK